MQDGTLSDDTVGQAVSKFQRLNGLEADGILGTQTLQALNFSAEQRVRQIIVNMGKPVEFAEYLLRNHPAWPPEKIRSSLSSSQPVEQTIQIPEPINIHILYWTVWHDHDNLIIFSSDIYGRDSALDAALRKPRPASFINSMGSDRYMTRALRTLTHYNRFCFFSAGLILLFSFFAVPGFSSELSPQKGEFSVRVNDLVISYPVMSVFAMPGEKFRIGVNPSREKSIFYLHSSAGKKKSLSPRQWNWQAPESPGHYLLNIANAETTATVSLNVFVMVPFDRIKGEYLNGYRIGKYPQTPLKQLAVYKPPRGFIEVTMENAETLISPHFRLAQFLCKQEGGYPKYLVLKERLLLKLELLVERINQKGYHCNSFHIMSGYRTPYYNKAIGNVKYSRHVYGDAADFFIDENSKDDMMDDLNRDGKINFKDAAIIYEIADELYGKKFYKRLIGGFGQYKKTTCHGPFVHVDIRGFRARWGD